MRIKSTKWPSYYNYPSWLPNWRDESEYLRIGEYSEFRFDKSSCEVEQLTVKTSKAAYAWEFLRRNPDYQTEYQSLVELCESEGVTDRYKRGLGFNIFSLQDDPPPSMCFHAALYRALRKWGLGYYLLDPSSEIHVTVPLDGVQRLGNDIYRAVHVEPFPIPDDETKTEPIPIDGGIIPTDTETFWLFDVALPLEPQLKKAREFLEGSQLRIFKKKKLASKTEPDKFVLYLRVLDADASGADSRDIMSVLFPGENGITYHDKNGELYQNDASHRNPGRDKLKNCRNAAYYLRDHGYRLMF